VGRTRLTRSTVFGSFIAVGPFSPFTTLPEGPLVQPFYSWLTGDLNIMKAVSAALLAQLNFEKAARAASASASYHLNQP